MTSAETSPFKCLSDSFKKMYRSMFRSHIEQAGRRQSPVDLQTNSVVYDSQKCEACSMSILCQPGDCDQMTLSPSTWKVTTINECQTTLKATHLPAPFRLLQFHAHWGQTADTGSEHTVDGKPYAGEVHFVFWNTGYGTAEVASAQPDGIAVLGVFLTEGKHHENMDTIGKLVEHCLDENKKATEMPKDFEITSIIPLGSEYFAYDGSLTTAPFSETVLWTVLIKPLEISKTQLDIFRRICSDNYRECQPLHGRTVFSSAEFNPQHIV